jgi:hypothetical protein
MTFYVCEKLNPLAVHAHCDTLEGAERWIRENAPAYVLRGYFMDKTLTADSFTIRKPKP